MKSILITGGAGFIGSHVVRLFVNKYPDCRIVNLDCLTYAGNLENLKDIENAPNYTFVRANICDAPAVARILRQYGVEGVVHLAAESHVDRSITGPKAFAETNFMGTLNLLWQSLQYWQQTADGLSGKRFYHISTDEVYGALHPDEPAFTETTPYSPHSPYSASKAASDHIVRAFHDTYGLPTIITNCSNNYGTHQFPEKLIPLTINNIRLRRDIPIYGQGLNIRDWLNVLDHARAIDLIFHEGRVGETYNIGGSNEWENIRLVRQLIRITDQLLGRSAGESLALIKFVTDRAGHDLRYAINSRKLQTELGWHPQVDFEQGLRDTVKWYLDNEEWVARVTSGEYQNYYEQMYANK